MTSGTELVHSFFVTQNEPIMVASFPRQLIDGAER